MTKRLKQRKQRDRIGGLPDEILVSILSLLPLKEAGGTCILSKRWRHLWTSLSTLTFAPAGGILVFHDQPTLELETSRFINWVDTVMEQHRLPKIEYLKISFDLSKIHAFWINKWIQIALKKRVEILDLDLLELGCCLRQFIPCYTLPQQLLHSSSEYIGSLKVIDFKSVAVTGKTLVYLLSICPFLERLSVYDSQKLVNLRVVGPSVAAALKYLSIEQCFKVKSIEISDAPKLVSLICHRVNDTFGEETTRLISFVIRNVPLLVEVSISVEWMEIFFMGIADCLSQLEILTFHPVMMKYVKYLQFPSLPNLKCLELRLTGLDYLSLLKLTSVIKACPYLHRFVLQLSHCTPMEGKKIIKVKASKSPHYYLKIVEIVGYRGLKSDYEHVMYFIENAVELEKLIINPVSQTLIIAERDRVPKDISEVKMEDKARADAMQHLRSKIPSNIEFVCLL